MRHQLKDRLEPRDWGRPWRDAPGFWSCCCGGAKGYTVGGFTGTTAYATCDKTDFKTESTSTLSSGNLSTARGHHAALANPAVAAYFNGGLTAVGSNSALCDKLDYATETTSATSSGNLSGARINLMSASERSTKGYFLGGSTTTSVATADKLTFSGDSTAAQSSADLSQSRYNGAGLTEGAIKGYVSGGWNQTLFSRVTTTDKLIYSTDATSALSGANLSNARFEVEATSDGTATGYVVGGSTSTGASSRMDLIAFSTDTSSLSSNSISSHQAGWAMSDGTKALVCGYNGLSSTAMSRIDFATGASTYNVTNLTISRDYPAQASTVAL